MLQCIKHVLQTTWRRCYNVSGTSGNLLGEIVTMYQERVERFAMKMLQPIRDVLQVTWRKWYVVSGMSSVLQVTWRICYNVPGRSSKNTWQRYYYVSKRRTWRNGYVSGTSCKHLANETTTYDKRLANYLTKMLQRIRNILQVTWGHCYNVSGTCLQLLDGDVTTYQSRLANYPTKMLQRIRNLLPHFYYVSKRRT